MGNSSSGNTVDTCTTQEKTYTNRKTYALYSGLVALVFILLLGFVFISYRKPKAENVYLSD